MNQLRKSADCLERDNELEALQSMYPDQDCLTLNPQPSTTSHNSSSSTSDNQHAMKGFFIIFPELSSNTVIKWQQESFEITYFPPFCCTFLLPENYPSGASPKLLLECDWLPSSLLHSLQQRIHEMVKENEGNLVLIAVFSFLHQDSLDFIFSTFTSTWPAALELSLLVNCLPKHFKSMQDYVVNLKENNRDRCHRKFLLTTHECEVCYLPFLGSKCVLFEPCEHLFCKKCVKQCYDLQVSQGNVQAFHCLASKCDSLATPSQLRSILSAQKIERVDTLLLNAALDTMDDIMYCTHCQFPVIVEKEDNIGVCENCKFAFCLRCKKSYHYNNPCSWRIAENDLLEYSSASGERKKFLEDKYTKSRLQAAWNDRLSEDYLKENNVRCPSCNTAIEKTGGCNKMTCSKCKTYFCWLCRTPLSANNPYSHFGMTNSPCYQMLFRGMVDEEEHHEEFEDNVALF